jgi:DNA-binding MarR family transcriptional regulator
MDHKLSNKHDTPSSARQTTGAAHSDVGSAAESLRPTAHIDLVRTVERVHRRSLDLYRLELARLGVEDVSPSQIMMLFTIGGDELSVRDLIERGYYLGSNASYNLKRLVEAGYVDRSASERDRRSARIRLSDKGRELCEAIRKIDEMYYRLVAHNPKEARELETAIKALKRLEQAWSSALRYGEGQDV